MSARDYRRKRPQTAHHRDIPDAVVITRQGHAFEGRDLAVIGSIRRRGVMLLLACLPDGSRSLIPAAWTDWQAAKRTAGPPSGAASIGSDEPSASSSTLGRLSDLLQARSVIDALRDRLAESARRRESGDAIEPGVSRTATAARSAAASIERSMGSDRSTGPRRSARRSRTSHCPHARRPANRRERNDGGER